jgi:uncharacterized protein (DUF302 family)
MGISTTESGVLNLSSSYPVEDTAKRLADELEQAGMTIFATIDQRAAAQEVDLAMKPMILLIFGNPKVGTPLMQTYPSLAIDLPLKALVWEDGDGQVWTSVNSPAFLQQRHTMVEAPFAGVQAILERALQ